MTDITEDGFLGGKLRIRQPATGYRAGVDPVFLAAAVPARAGERVLDMGCGVGTAGLCLGTRVPNLELWGLELQDRYAALAEENAVLNGMSLKVVRGDVTRIPDALKSVSFDHVIMNPPYFERAARSPAQDIGRETALAGNQTAQIWCDAGLRRLKPGGYLTLIQVPDQLPALMAALGDRAALSVHPLFPRQGRDASRVILVAQKGRRAPHRLAEPTVLHGGVAHEKDGEDYTASAKAVLRDGAPWPWNTG